MNRAKAKGTALESALVTYLKSRGHDARRVALAGALDEGDVRVQGWPLVFECKNTKAIAVGPFIDEANVEARNAGLPYGVAVVKRRGTTDVGKYHVLLDVDTFLRMLEERS